MTEGPDNLIRGERFPLDILLPDLTAIEGTVTLSSGGPASAAIVSVMEAGGGGPRGGGGGRGHSSRDALHPRAAGRAGRRRRRCGTRHLAGVHHGRGDGPGDTKHAGA